MTIKINEVRKDCMTKKKWYEKIDGKQLMDDLT